MRLLGENQEISTCQIAEAVCGKYRQCTPALFRVCRGRGALYGRPRSINVNFRNLFGNDICKSAVQSEEIFINSQVVT